MKPHPIELLINKADKAIVEEDFDTLLDIYSDDAVLVVKPGVNAVGKQEIHSAFQTIAGYFEHGLKVRQAGMEVLETGDTALVLARTVVSAPNRPDEERAATYVFVKCGAGEWRCSIDNSYGHRIVEEGGGTATPAPAPDQSD